MPCCENPTAFAAKRNDLATDRRLATVIGDPIAIGTRNCSPAVIASSRNFTDPVLLAAKLHLFPASVDLISHFARARQEVGV